MTKESDALDLEKDVFTKNDASEIARSPKASAEQSDRRKTNQVCDVDAGVLYQPRRRDPADQPQKVLEDAKEELRKEFGKRR